MGKSDLRWFEEKYKNLGTPSRYIVLGNVITDGGVRIALFYDDIVNIVTKEAMVKKGIKSVSVLLETDDGLPRFAFSDERTVYRAIRNNNSIVDSLNTNKGTKGHTLRGSIADVKAIDLGLFSINGVNVNLGKAVIFGKWVFLMHRGLLPQWGIGWDRVGSTGYDAITGAYGKKYGFYGICKGSTQFEKDFFVKVLHSENDWALLWEDTFNNKYVGALDLYQTSPYGYMAACYSFSWSIFNNKPFRVSFPILYFDDFGIPNIGRPSPLYHDQEVLNDWGSLWKAMNYHERGSKYFVEYGLVCNMKIRFNEQEAKRLSRDVRDNIMITMKDNTVKIQDIRG